MPKNALLPLVLWNIALSALVAWALLRAPHAPTTTAVPEPTEASYTPTVPRDTSALREARIAFFLMDSVRSGYLLVEESAARVRSEGRRLEGDLGKEIQKAQARAQQLASKDPTFSTKAEMEADREEFEGLQLRIQQLRESSQERIDELQVRMLQEISGELEGFLEEYNRAAGFDFIFSIQDGGQIWTGNKGLDITGDVIAGLNERHRARKAPVNAK